MTKKSFFEKLTGSYNEEENETENKKVSNIISEIKEENEEGQLAIDVWQTPEEIVIETVVAGTGQDALDIDLTHEMVTIRGRRESKNTVEKNNFLFQEIYWGSFSRSLILPQEVDPDNAEAEIKNGVLTIRLPKLDKERAHKLKIKNG